ncbi:hypothetical protein F5Y04DRAFT_283175 [Hypomontagnella monticulosa]|nr:hypothetical protein F5Y04DRAFT_283175 [Hypomontagnella monticulosa]
MSGLKSTPATPPGSASMLPRKRKTDNEEGGAPESAKKAHKTSNDEKPIITTPLNIYNKHLAWKKPEPHGEPPVWSERRGALADALPYFKAHEGGLYTKKWPNGKRDLYGVLIDKMVGVRDHFSSQVIITSCGGGRVFDRTLKIMVRKKDQKPDDSNVAAYYSALKGKSPVAVIAGAQHKGFPVLPQHYYSVLAYFHVTKVWPEKTTEGGKPRIAYMARLEKVDLSERSWWAPAGASKEEAGEYEVGEYVCPEKTCPVCKEGSKTIFNQGWTCLNRDCTDFFKFPPNQDIGDLSYSQNFLNERHEFHVDKFPKGPLFPAQPKRGDNDIGTEMQFKQGIVCPECKCCSRRKYWEHWECENQPRCQYKFTVKIVASVPIDKVRTENEAFAKSNRIRSDVHATIPYYKKTVGSQILTTYFLPDGPKLEKPNEDPAHDDSDEELADDGSDDDSVEDQPCGDQPCKDQSSKDQPCKDQQDEDQQDEEYGYVGTVTHIQASLGMCEKKAGLDELYRNLQATKLNLRRRGAKNPNHRIEELTSHFSANYGAPYKFGVVVDTSSGFEGAPLPVLEALARLTWAGKEAVNSSHVFKRDNNISITNEMMPEEFTAYNEQLVLGYFEGSKISAHDDGERELGPNVATLSLGSPSVMKFMPKKGYKLGDFSTTQKLFQKVRVPMLKLKLQHGDIVIMHGAAIQQRYLHSVDSSGKHRFALTCRYIRPETLPANIREAAEADAKVPQQWADVEYDGRRDCFVDKKTKQKVERPGPSVPLSPTGDGPATPPTLPSPPATTPNLSPTEDPNSKPVNTSRYDFRHHAPRSV